MSKCGQDIEISIRVLFECLTVQHNYTAIGLGESSGAIENGEYIPPYVRNHLAILKCRLFSGIGGIFLY